MHVSSTFLRAVDHRFTRSLVSFDIVVIVSVDSLAFVGSESLYCESIAITKIVFGIALVES
jgi:hypothetical protein